jgi:hypothetical protein
MRRFLILFFLGLGISTTASPSFANKVLMYSCNSELIAGYQKQGGQWRNVNFNQNVYYKIYSDFGTVSVYGGINQSHFVGSASTNDEYWLITDGDIGSFHFFKETGRFTAAFSHGYINNNGDTTFIASGTCRQS